MKRHKRIHRTGQGWLRRAESSLFAQHREAQRVRAELGVIADRRSWLEAFTTSEAAEQTGCHPIGGRVRM